MASPSKTTKTWATWQDLPLELVIAIVNSLAIPDPAGKRPKALDEDLQNHQDHDHGISRVPTYPTSEQRILGRLCLVSKAINEHATKMLYRNITITQASSLHDITFARTLLHRPELAQHVVSLTVPSLDLLHPHHSPAHDMIVIAMGQNGQHIVAPPMLHNNQQAAPPPLPVHNQALLSLLVLLAPNIEQLNVFHCDGSEIRRAGDTSRVFNRAAVLAALMQRGYTQAANAIRNDITSLALRATCPKLKTLQFFHEDSFQGMWNDSPVQFDLDPLGELMALPLLRCLRTHQTMIHRSTIAREIIPRRSMLSVLELLWCDMEVADLTEMLSWCENLEIVRVRWITDRNIFVKRGNYESRVNVFTRLMEALSLHQRSLKSLMLYLPILNNPSSEASPTYNAFISGAFTGFSALKSLVLDETFIFDSDRDPTFPEGEPYHKSMERLANQLQRCLPAHLDSLVIRCMAFVEIICDVISYATRNNLLSNIRSAAVTMYSHCEFFDDDSWRNIIARQQRGELSIHMYKHVFGECYYNDDPFVILFDSGPCQHTLDRCGRCMTLWQQSGMNWDTDMTPFFVDWIQNPCDCRNQSPMPRRVIDVSEGEEGQVEEGRMDEDDAEDDGGDGQTEEDREEYDQMEGIEMEGDYEEESQEEDVV